MDLITRFRIEAERNAKRRDADCAAADAYEAGMGNRERPYSWADALFEQAKAHQECYIAGMAAADENSPSARKLRRLIVVVEETLTQMPEDLSQAAWLRLSAAIEEARR